MYIIARVRPIICLGILFVVAPAIADEPSIEQIRFALDQFTRRVERLQGKQIVRFVNQSSKTRAANAPLIMEDLRVESDFKLDRVNKLIRMTESRRWYYRDISDEPFSNTGSIYSFDGEAGYTLRTTPGRPPLPPGTTYPAFAHNAPYRLIINLRKDPTEGFHYAWALAGLPCPGPNLTLAEILQSDQVRVGKTRRVAGLDCVPVTINHLDWIIEAALDPTVGWLPRSYQTTLGDLGRKSHFKVSEFRKVPVKDGGEPLWFPTKGTKTLWSNDQGTQMELSLINLEVNGPLERRDFQFDLKSLPPGVKVEGPGGISYTGNRKDLFQAVTKAIDATDEIEQSILNKSRSQLVPEQ